MQQDDQIVVGEAVALDLQLANVGSRGVATLIDLVITLVLQLAILIPIVVVGPGNFDAAIALLLLTEVLVVLGYPVGMETLWRGRTLGKAVMGLRVVRDDGGPIRFRHAFVRGLVGVVLEKPGLTYGILPGVMIPWTRRRKRLGDMAAGTLVVQERVPGRIDAPVAMPPALAGWAADLDLSRVDDELALRMRQFISRAAQLAPEARTAFENQMANEIVGRVGPPPAQTPAWTVIAAVLAERRRRALEASHRSGQASVEPTPWPAPQPAAPDPPTAPDAPTGFTPPS